MFPQGEDFLPYSLVLSGAAPFAVQLATGSASWPFLFLLFALPAVSLCLSLGQLSSVGPVLTFQRVAPIAAGIGWALAWLCGERLFVEGLRATQTVAYAVLSVRGMDWATECGHAYNTLHCQPFLEENVTAHEEGHRYPDNFWPAQQFNRYLVRGNPLPKTESLNVDWEPNEWYLGRSTEQFYLAFPSFFLLTAHAVLWCSVCVVLLRVRRPSVAEFLLYFCLVLPCLLYCLVLFLLAIFSFSFGPSVQDNIPSDVIEKDPIDFWADIKGVLRTSLVVVDYSSAFSGLLLFAASRRVQGAPPLKAFLLLPCMLLPPLLLSILRFGCEGHVASLQPAYRYYPTTDEIFTFDLLPVCFATSPGGPFISLLFYLSHFFYSALGPMIVYVSFMESCLLEQWPHVPRHIAVPGVVACFVAPSVLLYMPLGTKLVASLRYFSQSGTVALVAYFIIYFVYGWQQLEADLQSQSDHPTSFVSWLFSSVGPICTLLLFSFVPMLLSAKFAAVFDLLVSGGDVVKHVDLGLGQVILAPGFVARFVGSVFMLAPSIIVAAAASLALFSNYRSRLPWSTLLQPTPAFLSHSPISGQTPPRPHSLAYGFFNQLFPNMDYRKALLLVFIAECVLCVFVVFIFIYNTFFLHFLVIGGNMYRSFMLLVFASLHVVALFELRFARQCWDDTERLSLYIGMATMEMAMFNGYMWMFAWDFSWGADASPLVAIFLVLIIRGSLILTAIAVRAHISDVCRPTRTRDATEVYDAEVRVGGEPEEDDSPIIFELAR